MRNQTKFDSGLAKGSSKASAREEMTMTTMVHFSNVGLAQTVAAATRTGLWSPKRKSTRPRSRGNTWGRGEKEE